MVHRKGFEMESMRVYLTVALIDSAHPMVRTTDYPKVIRTADPTVSRRVNLTVHLTVIQMDCRKGFLSQSNIHR